MFKINSFSEYSVKLVEVQDLKDYRDRVEERGGSTTTIDDRIEEIETAILNFRREN